ncbi:MAG: thiamine phosphate synthase [Blastocatellia bacterium]|nr:thiamine phosphate synthase [Blastocatellia bacterium]
MAAIQLCLITDRTSFGTGAAAIDAVVRLARDASTAGVDWIQIREKDLSARDLCELTRRVVTAASIGSARVLVNDRFDVALAAGADGVHLTTTSMSARVVRSAVGSRLAIGASTHSEAEAMAASEAGTDFVVCGPIFVTPSKAGYSDPLGPGEVDRIASVAGVPLLALGGIDEQSAGLALGRSVSGIAAIRLFQDAWSSGGSDELHRVVHRLRLLR